MPSFEVAHIREQGQDMIIIPLDRSLASKSNSEQNQIRHELEGRAHAAGLRGSAVLVWETNDGRMAFLCPPNWQSFFRNVGLHWVAANINKQISW